MIQNMKFAIGSQNEDSLHPVIDQPVDLRRQGLLIHTLLSIPAKGCDHRGDDSFKQFHWFPPGRLFPDCRPDAICRIAPL